MTELQAGPCVVCGETNYPLSMGGPAICPQCDCQPAERRVPELLTRAKTAEAERDRLAAHADRLTGRVAELEFKVNENFTAAMRANARLQQATERFEEIIKSDEAWRCEMIARSALAALAGEDETNG